MVIVVNDIPPSNNKYMGNSHNFNEYRRDKDEWHRLVCEALINHTDKPKEPYAKAIVHIKYYFKDGRKRDPDNYSGKFILDPLVDEGVLADDSFGVVTLRLSGFIDKNNPRVEIEVTGI